MQLSLLHPTNPNFIRFLFHSLIKSQSKLQIQICHKVKIIYLQQYHSNLPRRLETKKEMLPISSNCGLPICLSGISRSLSLYQEMDDHERRREAMKKKKCQETLQLHEMIRAQNREALLGNGGETHEGDVNNGKISVATHEFSCISLHCTAKAA